MSASRSKAEERYAEIKKRDSDRKIGIDAASRQRLEKTARLKELRLAKEVEDAAQKQAEKELNAAAKVAPRKGRTSVGA